METLIDIVIVSFNTRELLERCLQTIKVHTDVPYRIIVVDNKSHDGSAQAAKQLGWPELTVIENKRNVGYAKACNQGIRVGASPYIILLNSDIMVTTSWVSPMIECMRTDPTIAVVGPKLVDQENRIAGAGVVGSYANHWSRGYMEPDEPGKYDTQEDCISVCGAAYLIRRDLLPTIGLFDEGYFFYFEETDYSFHVHSLGYRVVYCPQSKLIHLGGQSSHDHVLLRRYFNASQRRFRHKWKHLMKDTSSLGGD